MINQYTYHIGATKPTRPPLTVYLALAQGFYYLVTGIWPLLDIVTFQLVTGPKTDLWLVKTVGVLVSVIGAVLFTAGLRRRISPELTVLAIGSALGLAGIDIIYVWLHRISPIYLLDAVAEIILAGLWMLWPDQPLEADRPMTPPGTSSVSTVHLTRMDCRFVTHRSEI